jgi:hypothetical protein
MSEQLASSTLQQRYVEEVLLDPLVNHTSPSPAAYAASAFFVNHTSPESVDTTSDFMIARMLQLQFSKEHDEVLRRSAMGIPRSPSVPPCIETGDAGSFDMQLSNKVSSFLIITVINSLTK